MTTTHVELWNNLLAYLKNEVSDQVFNAWFLPIAPVSLSDDKLILGVPNDFFKEWIRERYIGLLNLHLGQLTGNKVSVELVVSREGRSEVYEDADKKISQKEKKGWFRSVFPKQPKETASPETKINSKYTFENFVVGPSNRFAHAASLAIADSPAKAYNPLFIYGLSLIHI